MSGQSQFPVGRKEEFEMISNLIGQNSPFTSCLAISGPPGSGKSTLVKAVLAKLTVDFSLRWVEVSCLEACPSRQLISSAASQQILLNLILHQFQSQYVQYPKSNVYCDNTAVFVELLTELLLHSITPNDYKTVCFVLYQAERLRDASCHLLPFLVNLNSLIADYLESLDYNLHPPHIVTLLVTTCPWEKFYVNTFVTELIVLHLKAYTRDQLAAILVNTFQCESPRYPRFVDLLLTVCLPVTRNVGELMYLAESNWRFFNEPVLAGKVSANDEWAQWRHALPFLRHSLSTIYLRPELTSSISQLATSPDCGKTTIFSTTLELPFYARYLLVAAYIASFNPKKTDKKFFVKNLGKLSSRAKHQEKKNEHKNSHMSGPSFFSLDRLLAIFYGLLELEDASRRPPAFSALFAGQIAILCELGLIGAATAANAAGSLAGDGGLPSSFSNHDDPFANPRYRCLASLEAVKAIAKSIDLNLLAFLVDFT